MPDFELIESILGIAETGQFDRATDVMARNIDGCVGLHRTFTTAGGARRQLAYSLTPEVVGERLKTDFRTPRDDIIWSWAARWDDRADLAQGRNHGLPRCKSAGSLHGLMRPAPKRFSGRPGRMPRGAVGFQRRKVNARDIAPVLPGWPRSTGHGKHGLEV